MRNWGKKWSDGVKEKSECGMGNDLNAEVGMRNAEWGKEME